MKLLRDLKPKPVDHQYPKFLSCERSTLISQSTLEVFKVQLLAVNAKKGARCPYRDISSEVPVQGDFDSL